jgi:hypothetical protein
MDLICHVLLLFQNLLISGFETRLKLLQAQTKPRVPNALITKCLEEPLNEPRREIHWQPHLLRKDYKQQFNKLGGNGLG